MIAWTLSQKGMILNYYFLFWDKGNEPKKIGNDDLGYVSQIFLPKTMGNHTMPCGFVYVIAPQIVRFWMSQNFLYIIPQIIRF